MLTTIRTSTFETNSSSVHAFVFVPNEISSEWVQHPNDWIDFGMLLDEVGAKGPAVLTEPVIVRTDCFVSEEEARAKTEWRCDDEEIIGQSECLPYDVLVNPEKYREWAPSGSRPYPIVNETEDGVMIELDYDGWRD